MNFNKYIKDRLEKEHISNQEFYNGYESYKIGVLNKEEREESNMSQQEVTIKINTTKSTISRK